MGYSGPPPSDSDFGFDDGSSTSLAGDVQLASLNPTALSSVNLSSPPQLQTLGPGTTTLPNGDMTDTYQLPNGQTLTVEVIDEGPVTDDQSEAQNTPVVLAQATPVVTLPGYLYPPQVTLQWSKPNHAASSAPNATPSQVRYDLQYRFASGTGQPFYIDPQQVHFESAIDIGQQIQDSMNNPNGYMHGLLSRAIQNGGSASFSTQAWGARRFQNPLWNMDNIGRVAGTTPPGTTWKLTVNSDGTYTATGTMQLKHTGLYNWSPDGENGLKDFAIRAGGDIPFNYNGNWQYSSVGTSTQVIFTRSVTFTVHGTTPPLNY
jgi:hypothetical protein